MPEKLRANRILDAGERILAFDGARLGRSGAHFQPRQLVFSGLDARSFYFQGFISLLQPHVCFVDASLSRPLLCFQFFNALFGQPQLFNSLLGQTSGAAFDFVGAILDAPDHLGRLIDKR